MQCKPSPLAAVWPCLCSSWGAVLQSQPLAPALAQPLTPAFGSLPGSNTGFTLGSSSAPGSTPAYAVVGMRRRAAVKRSVTGGLRARGRDGGEGGSEREEAART